MFEANWTLFIRGEANRDEQINVANELLSILTRTINNRKGDEYNQRRTLPLASDSLKEPTDMHILLIHKYGLRVVGSIVEEIVLFGFITLFTSILFLDYIHHFVHRHILGSVGSTVLLGPFPILQWPWTFSPPHENRWRLLPWLTHIEKDLHFNVYCKGAPSISEMDWVVRYPQETDNPVSFLNARGTEHTEGYNSTPLTYWRSKPSSNERTR